MTQPSFDPGYTGEITSFIRATFTESTGYDVEPDATLTDRAVEIVHRERLVRVRPGQPLARFHQWMDRAWLYTIGGSAWAPEFRSRPRLRLVEAGERHVPAPPGRNLCDSCKRGLEGE